MTRLDWKSAALGSLVGALGATALYAAQPTGPVADRAAVEGIVRDYILAHPEIIPQAIERYQAQATGRLIEARRKEIETPFPGAVAGNPAGDVTLVEFFDYACGYCRASLPDVDRLIAEDTRLRVVFRELPILSPDSEKAARSSLAAAKAGSFLAFHRAMYRAGRVDPQRIAATEKATGTPAPATSDPVQTAEIERNLDLARDLRLTGTPSFVVGDQILSGAVGYDKLKAAVAAARAKKAG